MKSGDTSLCIPRALVCICLSDTGIGRGAATFDSVDRQKGQNWSYRFRYQMCWQNCTSCGHKPTGFICPGAGTESDSGKMLRVLPHLLNQAVLRNTTHPSHYTQLYWADLWSLDLGTWNQATITFLPSFQGPALPLLRGG